MDVMVFKDEKPVYESQNNNVDYYNSKNILGIKVEFRGVEDVRLGDIHSSDSLSNNNIRVTLQV